MNKVTNIEELFELINPELLTTEESCKEMLINAYNNKCILENYAKKVQIKLEKLYKKKNCSI